MSSSASHWTRRRALALPLAATFVATGATPSRAARVITDALGRTVELPGPARRIVVAFYLEEFTAIAGAAGWEQAVGFRKHQWAVNRAKTYRRFAAAIPRLDALPDVGAGEEKLLIAEKVLAEKPDLIIAPPWALGANRAEFAPLEASGIPFIVVDYNAQTLDKHVASTLAIGQAVGAEDRAQALADLYRAKMADILARAKSANRKPKTYIEIGWLGAGEFGSTYKNTMWGRLLDMIGADNVANAAMPAASGFQPIAPEAILAARPEHIFITGSSWAGRPNAVQLGYDVDLATARATLKPYLARPGWADLPAVKDGNVYTVEHSLIRSLTDWISLQFIAKQLYPAEFADVDPVASLRDFHARFLPVAFAGTWMARLAE
ncbi:MAG: ABC transporter substrate-binding protein [Rhizobiales bacterium]|nr:ABC transporter substrate-binding protein [Hyphomicrobiales bacterium]